MEKIETNKLYRNQRKLEQTEQGLYYNKQQYKNAQEELYSLQVQLENALRNYRAQQYATNKRINQIFKTKRKNYVQKCMCVFEREYVYVCACLFEHNAHSGQKRARVLWSWSYKWL